MSARVPWKGPGLQQRRLLNVWQALTDVNFSVTQMFDSCPSKHTVQPTVEICLRFGVTMQQSAMCTKT